ncbi:MAG: peptide chain release factor 2 [Planctomycetes bacterium]|nr:peptide chain release factor 2 [Planctomycetota bacterium]
MNPEEIRPALKGQLLRLENLKDSLDLAGKKIRLGELEAQMVAQGFWNNQEASSSIIAEVKGIRSILMPWEECFKSAQDSLEMLDMAEEEGEDNIIEEVGRAVENIFCQLDLLDTKGLLNGKHDDANVYFTIHSGAGGTESCDWVHILWRMYSRFFEDQGWKCTLLSALSGEEAGFKTVSLHLTGSYAYGYIKGELGVHRLVRISPFDSNKRRHTSFASVDVVPDLGDALELPIDVKDLRIDTYRASGAGGQHVNKTDSAVRITHLPTSTVVQCQTERSQLSNKETAMSMLKAKLWQLQEEKKQDELDKISGTKSSISWGSQIRSYVFQPYQMIKDHRTHLEIGNIQSVLDGNIFPFLKRYLEWKASH